MTSTGVWQPLSNSALKSAEELDVLGLLLGVRSASSALRAVAVHRLRALVDDERRITLLDEAEL